MADTGAKFIITEIKGEAYVRKENGEIIKLNAGDILEEGDVLLTGDGEVTLADESGAELTVPANYTLTLAATLPPELPDTAEEIPAGEEAPLPEATDAPDAPVAPQEQAPGPDGPGISDGGGSSFFNAPKTDYRQDNRFIDQGNLNRDVNEIFSFMGRHTENPRIHYRFDLDRVQFPLYGPEPDQWGGGRRDDYTPPIGQHEPDNSDLDGRFELAPDANSVKEDGPLTASGSVLANDSGKGLKVVGVMKHGDPGAPSSGNVGSEVQGEYGTVKINADGTYTYVLDNDDDRVQALAVGEKFTETFVYSATDQRGETQTTTLTITINGTNDVPVIDEKNVGKYTGELTEGQVDFDKGVDGKLPVKDVDTSDIVRVKVIGVEIEGNTPDGLESKIGKMLEFENETVIVNGENDGEIHWKFNPGDEDFKYLGEEETLKLTYTVEVDDGHGGKDQKEITITINGRNDPPTANPDTREMKVGSADEGEDDGNWKTSIIRGNVITGGAPGDREDTDPDINDVLKVVRIKYGDEQGTVGSKLEGEYGEIVINEDGSYTYTLNNEHPDFENFGKSDEPKTETFTYTIADRDGQGETRDTTITIKISGAMLFADSNTVNEDASDQEGYDDENSGTSIIAGNVLTNDKAEELEVTKIANSDNAEASVAQDTSYNNGTEIAGQYGTLKIGADGKYTYTLNNENPDVDALAVEEKLTEKFTYTAVDKDGDEDSTTLTITINGANDTPVIKLVTDGDGVDSDRHSFTESDDPLSVTGTLTPYDVDTSDTVTVGKTDVVNIEGTFKDKLPAGFDAEKFLSMFEVSGGEPSPTEQENPHGIEWTFDSGKEAFNFLPEGETIVLTYTVEADDGNGGKAWHDITITITGTNDAPELDPDVNTVKEDDADHPDYVDETNDTTIVGGNVLDNDTDEDDGDVLRVTKIKLGGIEEEVATGSTAEDDAAVINGVYGELHIGADGTYKYVLDNTRPEVQALAEDQTETEVFTYTVTDDKSADVSTTLTINVKGANDAPKINVEDGDSDEDLSLTDKNLDASGTLTPYDVDIEDTVRMDDEVTVEKDTGGGGYDIPETLTDQMLLNMFTFTGGNIDGNNQTNLNDIEWEFKGTPGAFDFIPTGKSLELVYTLRAIDSKGATGDKTVTIKITGEDDTGSLGSGVVTTTNEDETKTGNVLTTDSPGFKDDPDYGEQVQITGFTIEGMPGDPHKLDTSVSVTNSDNKVIGTFTLKANGDYTFVPTADYSGPVPTITYAAKSGSAGSGWEDIGHSTLKITVNPVADAPKIPVNNVWTPEDTPVSLGLTVPILKDQNDLTGTGDDHDNPERLGEITLSGFPAGSQLLDEDGKPLVDKDGNELDPFVNDNSSITITITDDPEYHVSGASGTYQMSTAQYKALQVLPPKDAHENFTVTVSATSYEVNKDGSIRGDVPGAKTTETFNVVVKAVTDMPDLKWDGSKLVPGTGGVEPGSTVVDPDDTLNLVIKEDTEINLKDILKASFEDTDGSETRWFVIENPKDSGFSIVVNGETVDPGQTSEVISASGLSTSTTDFPDIKIAGGKDFSGKINGIKVHFLAQDFDGKNNVLEDDLGNATDENKDFGAKIGGGYAESEKDTLTLNMTVTPKAGDVTRAVESEIPEDPLFNNKVNETDEKGVGAKFLEGLKVTDEGHGEEKITQILLDPSKVEKGWSINDENGDLVIKVSEEGEITYGEGVESALVDGKHIIPHGNDEYKLYTAVPPPHSSKDTVIKVFVTTEDKITIDGTPYEDSKEVEVTAKVIVTPVAEKIGVDSDGDGNADLTTPTEDYVYDVTAKEDTYFELNQVGKFSLEKGEGNGEGDSLWYNADGKEIGGSEDTYALFNPQYNDDGVWKSAIGSTFEYNDGSETIVKSFAGAPVEIPIQYLDTVRYKAPENAAGQFQIEVSVRTVDYDYENPETTNTYTSGVRFTLTNLIVEPVADDVTLQVAQTSGKEDTEIDLKITPHSGDPRETFVVTISAIPAGAVLKYDGSEVEVTDGSWTIENFNSSKPLTITPPLDSNEDIYLNVKSHAVDKLTINGKEYGGEPGKPDELTYPVYVKGVADAANLETQNHQITEAINDGKSNEIALRDAFTASLQDNDGSETLSLVISGLGTGFSIEGGSFIGGGKWSVSKEAFDEGDAKLITPKNFSGTATFHVTAITTEDDGDFNDDAKETVEVKITPSPEALITTFDSGQEDEWTNLDFGIKYQNGDDNETIEHVWIDPSSRDADKLQFTIGENGTTPESENGWYKIAWGDLDNVWVKGPANGSGKYHFDIKYEVKDPSTDGNLDPESVVKDAEYELYLAPVTDETATTLGFSGVVEEEATFDGDKTITVSQETTFTLEVTVKQAGDNPDNDGSEKLEYVIVDGIPPGMTIEGGYLLYNLPESGNKTTQRWIYPVGDKYFESEDGIKLELICTIDNSKGAFDWADAQEEFGITVTAWSLDTEGSNVADKQESSFAEWTLIIKDLGEADGELEPLAQVSATLKNEPETLYEDAGIKLGDLVDFSINPDLNYPNPRFAITLTFNDDKYKDIEIDGMMKTTRDGKTVWVAYGQGSQPDLNELVGDISVKLPENWNSNEDNDGHEFNFEVGIEAYTPGGQKTEQAPITITPDITPVTDHPVIEILATGGNEGVESIPITINLSNDADGKHSTILGDDDGKIYIKLDESGYGKGELWYDGQKLDLTHVENDPYLDNGQYYVISGVEYKSDIELSFKPDTHTSGEVKITTYVVTQEDNADELLTPQAGSFTINPINSGYDMDNFSASGNEHQRHVEGDGKIPLPLPDDHGLFDSDGSEEIVSVTLSGLPTDYIVYVGDDMAQNVGGGAWSIKLTEDGKIPDNISILPKEYDSGEHTLTLNIFTKETALDDIKEDHVTITLNVDPVASGVEIAPTKTFGETGKAISLNLNAEMHDLDGSETMSLSLQGLPEEGVTFNHGDASYDPDSETWTITNIAHGDINKLTFTTDTAFTGTVDVKAWTVETSNYDSTENDAKWEHFNVSVEESGDSTGYSLFGFTSDGFDSGESETDDGALAASMVYGAPALEDDGNAPFAAPGYEDDANDGLMHGDQAEHSPFSDGYDGDPFASGGADSDSGSSAGYEPFPHSGEGDSAGYGSGSSSGDYDPFPSSGEGDSAGYDSGSGSASPSSYDDGSTSGSDWNSSSGDDANDTGFEPEGHSGMGDSGSGSDVIPLGAEGDIPSAGYGGPDSGSDSTGQGGLDEALEGLSADDVFDMGNDDLPLPGGDGDDGLGVVPEGDYVDSGEYFAPDVPDSAAQIADEMEEALSA